MLRIPGASASVNKGSESSERTELIERQRATDAKELQEELDWWMAPSRRQQLEMDQLAERRRAGQPDREEDLLSPQELFRKKLRVKRSCERLERQRAAE
ncbi:unnamed protein product [Parajaminaea phylloscopi]